MAPKRPKRPKDFSQAAKLVVDIATGQVEDRQLTPDSGRGSIAAELGRRGGLKGGRARAEALDKKERTEIARRAAAARWKKDDD